MIPSIRRRLEQVADRFEEVTGLLADASTWWRTPTVS